MSKLHLEFGGSNAQRWLLCPGSIALCRVAPPKIENEAMAAGTRAHALLEHALVERLEDVTGFDGFSMQPGWPAYTEEDVEAVQEALDYIWPLIEKHPDAEYWAERFEEIEVAGQRVGGSVDCRIYIPSIQTLYVIDYKHGYKFVSEIDNKQMKLYSATGWMNFDRPVKAIYGVIIQPRRQGSDPVRATVWSPVDLMNYMDDVDDAVRAALAPDAPRTPGEAQCTWCPAASICPEARRGADALTTPLGDAVTLYLPPPGSCMEPSALAQTLDAALKLEVWIDAIKDRAYEVAMGGAQLPGFKLTEKQARTRWDDKEAAANWLVKQLDPDVAAPRKVITPKQAITALKKAGKEDLVKEVAGKVTKESSGLKLVPVDAPGEAIHPRQLAAADFGAAVTL